MNNTNTQEYYYWGGFLLADGSKSPKYNVIRLAISIKDIDHLTRWKCYTNNQKPIVTYGILTPVKKLYKEYVRIDYKDTLDYIDTFDIQANKTYQPPSVSVFKKMNDTQFMSMLIGYIDGDGNISKQTNRQDTKISMQCHSSWFEIYKCWHIRLSKITGVQLPLPKIINNGYLRWDITNMKIVNYLKSIVLEYNLPVLSRKWDIIDLNYVTKKQKTKDKHEIIMLLKSQGKTIKEISKVVDLSFDGVCNHLYQKSKKIKG